MQTTCSLGTSGSTYPLTQRHVQKDQRVRGYTAVRATKVGYHMVHGVHDTKVKPAVTPRAV
jgi:hypothetical protein